VKLDVVLLSERPSFVQASPKRSMWKSWSR